MHADRKHNNIFCSALKEEITKRQHEKLTHMKKIIITINRECGSGGGSIATLLGQKLNMKVYSRHLLENVAKEYGITMEEMDTIKAQKTSWWDDFCRFYQQFGAASHTVGSDKPTPMSIFYAESRLLRDLAEKESCIIVGRAGFHIFRDNPDAHHILITARRENRIARLASKYHMSPEEAARTIDRVDRERDTFITTVAQTSRYDARNYNLCLDVSDLDINLLADFLAENIRKVIA